MENFSLRVPLASHSNATNSLGLLVELFVVHLDDAYMGDPYGVDAGGTRFHCQHRLLS